MDGPDPPAFGAERLLLFGTGSLRVAQLPGWVDWLRVTYPAVDLRIVLKRARTIRWHRLLESFAHYAAVANKLR